MHYISMTALAGAKDPDKNLRIIELQSPALQVDNKCSSLQILRVTERGWVKG